MKKTQLARQKVNEKTSLASARSYRNWILDLRKRYKAMQCKAAVAVNSAMLEFYWNLGKDISVKYPGRKRGLDFFGRVSRDVNEGLQAGVTALSTSNIRYAHRFYVLYASYFQQLAEQMTRIPWGHHLLIIDKCHACPEKAYFYVSRTIQNGWSRNSLLNWLSTDLYEREGKGQTNFALTMPSNDCDLAQQLVKDPQVFEVFGLKEQYNETELKAAIVANIERTLLSLFARNIIAFLRSSILKSLGCRWASPTMSSRRSCRPKPSLRSAMPMPRRSSPQQRLRRRKGRRRNDGLSLQRTVFVFSHEVASQKLHDQLLAGLRL